MSYPRDYASCRLRNRCGARCARDSFNSMRAALCLPKWSSPRPRNASRRSSGPTGHERGDVFPGRRSRPPRYRGVHCTRQPNSCPRVGGRGSATVPPSLSAPADGRIATRFRGRRMSQYLSRALRDLFSAVGIGCRNCPNPSRKSRSRPVKKPYNSCVCVSLSSATLLASSQWLTRTQSSPRFSTRSANA
jgi:hypothetical protein